MCPSKIEQRTVWDLEPGSVVKRTTLHPRYGGSGRSGISPSAQTPNVLVFSDPARGERYGYRFDGWKPDGAFDYTGEGQHGDQEMTGGNAAILHHRERGRALRVFKGVGGSVSYIGEFQIDPAAPWRWDEAPDIDGELRQVIVFRLQPRGPAARSPGDEAPIRLTGNRVTTVPLEAKNTDQYSIQPTSQPTQGERREQALVHEYRAFLASKGRMIARRRYEPPGEQGPIYCDAFEEARANLIEAKGTVSREGVRMAIGQLLDYGRFEQPNTARAVLLPVRPRSDLEALLSAAHIYAVWRSAPNLFEDNAEGRFL